MDLNLTVGGTIQLNTEALKLLGEQLLTIKVQVLDADYYYDNLKTDETFQLGFAIPNLTASTRVFLLTPRH